MADADKVRAYISAFTYLNNTDPDSVNRDGHKKRIAAVETLISADGDLLAEAIERMVGNGDAAVIADAITILLDVFAADDIAATKQARATEGEPTQRP
jgi:hypothetical protein